MRYERVIPNDLVLDISDFEAVGIKTLRQYDVTDLPGATDAWFGFRPASDVVPAEFELRFYKDHPSAVDDGVFYADDVVGEDANLLSTNAAWLEGIDNRRRWWGGDNDMFVRLPNYNDYVIYGNTLILCEGRWPEKSQDACNWLIDRLEKQVTR